MIRELLFFEPQGNRTQIGDAMHYLNNILRGHAIVFLLSDFNQVKINDVRELTQALEIKNRRHDLVCLNINFFFLDINYLYCAIYIIWSLH